MFTLKCNYTCRYECLALTLEFIVPIEVSIGSKTYIYIYMFMMTKVQIWYPSKTPLAFRFQELFLTFILYINKERIFCHIGEGLGKLDWILDHFSIILLSNLGFFQDSKVQMNHFRSYAIPLFDPHANSLLTLVITLIPIGKKASKITRNLFHIKWIFEQKYVWMEKYYMTHVVMLRI